MGKRPIPPDKFVMNKGLRKYTMGRRCAAMYRNGHRAGMQCSWYAMQDSQYCQKHGRFKRENLLPEHIEKMVEGRRNWWARLRALEQEYPGIIRQKLNLDKGKATRAAHKIMPKPKTEDPVILKAHKAIIAEVVSLPAVPNKPFDQLEPHEQLTVITGQSLRVVHEILSFPLKDKDGNVNPKVASMVKDTALRALSVRVKIDHNALASRKLDKMGEILARLKAGDNIKTIEASHTVESE